MKIAVQMDAPHTLKPAGDSTIVLLREAAARGMALYYYHHTTLRWKDGNVYAALHPLTVQDGEAWYTLDEANVQPLSNMDVVLMRQDPPFDMGYITATYLLERIQGNTRVINDPASVRSYPEKLLPLMMEEVATPDTLITADSDDILAFLATHKDIILKPLYGFGGHAVLRLREGGDNVLALLEMLRLRDPLPIIAQPFLPAVEMQDIRVVLIHGQIAGAFARAPASGEIRANMRVGGTPVPYTLNAKQQALCERIAPMLDDMGLHLAGLDLIGEHLTEINVTSPTGLRTLEKLYNTSPAKMFWDGVKSQSS
jgi:glutathione synthase